MQPSLWTNPLSQWTRHNVHLWEIKFLKFEYCNQLFPMKWCRVHRWIVYSRSRVYRDTSWTIGISTSRGKPRLLQHAEQTMQVGLHGFTVNAKYSFLVVYAYSIPFIAVNLLSLSRSRILMFPIGVRILKVSIYYPRSLLRIPKLLTQHTQMRISYWNQ